MDRKQFCHTIKKTFGYSSSETGKVLFEKIPYAPTLMYYGLVIKVIFDHSLIAKRGAYTRETWADGSVAMMNIAEYVGGKIRISGLEDVSGYKGPLVYIANHMSMIDAFFLPGILLTFNNISFVIKEALLDYPFFGKIMRAVTPIAVTRQNPREDLRTVINEGLKRLSQGCSVIVFPQATRNHVFDAARFNTLGIKLAKKAGVPVVPVALKTDFQGYGSFIKDLGKIDPGKTIHIRFGKVEPVDPKGQKTHESIVAFIAENIRGWGGEVHNVS